MLKAISASLLMEQVLAPRYEFTPKNAGPQAGFDYGDDGYKEGGHNIGVNKDTGQIHLEIAGLTKPETPDLCFRAGGQGQRGRQSRAER